MDKVLLFASVANVASTIYSTYDRSQFRQQLLQLINQLDEDHKERIDRLETEHKKNVERVRKQNQNTLQQNEDEHRKKLKAMDEERAELLEQFKSSKKEMIEKLDNLNRELENIKEESIKENEEKRKEMIMTMEKYRKEIDDARMGTHKVAQETLVDKRKHFEEQKDLVLKAQAEFSDFLQNQILQNAYTRCLQMYEDAWKPITLRMASAFNEMRTTCDEATYDKASFLKGSLGPFKNEIASAQNAFINKVSTFMQDILSEVNLPLAFRTTLINNLDEVKKLLRNARVTSHAAVLASAYDKKDLKTMKAKIDLLNKFEKDIEELKAKQQTWTSENKLMDSLCAETSQLKLEG
ncbi:hypothetical protein B9Z55_017381 [Caenorhabditis nigoni]|uniref:Uncharacterized protein n=1 Tax=Caenorhabditis nigoni TaxID=1611254 RepID=A0A2G5T9B0_9PELO|nr:hypothetical protein B9Z55_017381 [Caenorhabditis nigoni]